MEGLRDVEYLPEPSDRRIVSAADPTVVGFQDEWRSEIMGWAPLPVEPVVRVRRGRISISGLVVFAVLVSLSLLLWHNNWIVYEFQYPDSEWAYEQTGLREVQGAGMSGEGVRLCMVDTGIDMNHEAFEGQNVVFKDFVGSSLSPVDYGAVAHGTLMAGLLISNGHQQGAAPNIALGMAAALQDNGEGENTGFDSDVADAIRWCQFDFQADIISLSLGGTERPSASEEGSSSSATRQATDAGVYVVAAAGNDGTSDDGDIATPGSVRLAISVGATTREGTVWENSSIGSNFNEDGSERTFPHQKPEIVAPGHEIISTGEDSRWYLSSGTSDATVFVAGSLALLLEANPSLKPSNNGDSSCLELVKRTLADTAAPMGEPGHDARSGYGMVQADALVEALSDVSAC